MLKQIAKLQKEQQINHLFSKDKKTNAQIQKKYYQYRIKHERIKLSSLLHPQSNGYLEPQYQGQQTINTKQSEIAKVSALQHSNALITLKLNFGTYRCHFSRNGGKLMLNSSQGHLSLLNWRQKQLQLELHLQQKIISGTFLHNDEMFALVQHSNTYIYDNKGIQLHKLQPMKGIQYLPYHFLLVGYDDHKIKYWDTTTGNIIANHSIKPYCTTIMRQNFSNAIIALGNRKGVVDWWTPGVGKPVVSLFAGAAITDVGFYKQYMYTASNNVKIWDTRMLKIIYQYPLHRKISSLEISQNGLLTLNYGFKLQFYKQAHLSKQTHPYLSINDISSSIMNGNYVPFEDLMGLGLSDGFRMISVPGSCLSQYDTYELNPFQTIKQKHETLVHNLLQKLPAQTITCDPNIIGTLSKQTKQQLAEQNKKKQQIKIQNKKTKQINKKHNRLKNKVIN